MLHITNLAVGVSDVAHLAALQQGRLALDPRLQILTRSTPRRAEEVLDGGSLYWVIAGAMVVRQRLLDITPALYDDGSACAALVLDPELVPVAGRLTRPFQGWRYLQPAEAPPDIAASHVPEDATALPPALRRALQDLRLL